MADTRATSPAVRTRSVTGLRVCIDVDDLERGIRFYTRALGLTVGRRAGASWVELLGGPVPIDLLAKPPGSAASPATSASREYTRHWTPIHLDLVVDDLDSAVARACEAGARLERPIQEARWGRLANLGDPFGHGLCVVEFRGRGYDELLGSP
jgi:predicted enzyme related to lactoylglutathione lyase